MVPTAPTEAASVGVATPARIEPSTQSTSAIGGTSALAISPAVTGARPYGAAGEEAGSRIALAA